MLGVEMGNADREKKQRQFTSECTTKTLFLGWDHAVADTWYADPTAYATELYQLMLEAIREAGTNGTLNFLIISSWAIGGATRVQWGGSIVFVNQCIAQDRWVDVLPDPVYANATTAAQMFSTDFSDVAKQGGRQRLINLITAMHSSDIPSVIILDTNKLVLDHDPNSPFGSAFDLLSREFNMHRQPYSFDQELVPHLDPSKRHSVVADRPLCAANDSRDFVKYALRIKRTMAAATCVNFARLLENKTGWRDHYSSTVSTLP